MFYGCSLVRNQVGRGDEIYELQPVYVLCIANYCRIHESETPGKLLFSYQFREEETNELFGNQLGIYVLEVPRAEGLTEGMSKGTEQMRESIKARLEKLGLSQELIDEALKA